MNYEDIIYRLCDCGWDAYLVGGAARDLFLGQDPIDYDIVTDAPYDQVQNLFSDRKVSIVGKSFNVCIIDGYEVSSYRVDRYFGLSSHNCIIEDAETLEEDLARRDLTINSLAFCPYTGDLIDPYDGLNDLNHKIINFVGDPDERIYEDPCRIIRACRFLAKISGRLDIETEKSLIKNNELIKYVKAERIRLEIMKVMRYKQPSLFFKSLNRIGLLEHIFPELIDTINDDGGRFHNESVFDHCMIVGDTISPRCPLTRLAGYLHDIGKPLSKQINSDCNYFGHEKVGEEIARKRLTELRFSKKEVDHVCSLIRFHMRSMNKVKPKTIRKYINRFNSYEVNYLDFIRLKVADKLGNLANDNYKFSEIKEMINLFEHEIYDGSRPKSFNIKDLDINGNDIMNLLKIQQGPYVGNILNELFELVLDDPSKNNKEYLVNHVRH